MVQLRVLSGKAAGADYLLRRFPCVLGRSARAGLRFEEPGVWEQHLEIGLDRQKGFHLTALPDAKVMLNGQPVEEALLRNGDVIDAGALQLQFWLSSTRQRPLRFRERLTWGFLTCLFGLQVLLIYLLLR